MCHEHFENWFTNKKKINVQKCFCIAKGDYPKSFTLDSGKFVDLIQTFGSLVSFSYNLVLVLCVFNKH